MKNHTNIFWFITFHRKILIGTKPMLLRFDKAKGFIRVYDGSRYLVLFVPEKYDAIYNRSRYRSKKK